MYRKRKSETITVEPRVFIKAWQESNSVAEVAFKVRSKKNAVRVRAFRFRQRGVLLKEFPPVEWEPPDWGELAEYGASLLPNESADDDGEDDAGNGEAASPA